MLLNIPERVAAFGLLPERSNFATLRIIDGLRRELAISEEESEECGIVFGKDQITWQKNIEKEFTFSDRAKDMIIEGLKKLDTANEMEPRHMSLWRKFIGED